MEKKRISVNIEGRSYAVITTDDEDYVKQVAKEVSDAVLRASRSGMQLDIRDCAILAALDFCDDRNKAAKRNKDLVDKADQIIKQTNELNRQVKDYKNRLTDAINENTALTKRIRALEEQLRVLNKENEKLKKSGDQRKPDGEKKFEKTVSEKKAEKIMGYVPMRQASLFDEGSNSPIQNIQTGRNTLNNLSRQNNHDSKKGKNE